MSSFRVVRPSIVVVPSADPLFDRVADEVVARLTSGGEQARRARLVEPLDDLVATERLWLIGRASSFQSFARRLAGLSSADRPRTTLWQFDPLPPSLFSQRGDALANVLERPDWRNLLGGWATGLDRWLPPRGRVKGMIRQLVGLRLKNELARIGGADHAEIGLEELRRVLDESRWLQANAGANGWIDSLAVSCAARTTHLAFHGVPSAYVPFGWREPSRLDRRRDIDVLFVGRVSSVLKREVMPQLLDQLRRWGYHVDHLTGEEPADVQLDVMRRSRTLLHIPNCPWDNSAPRLTIAASGGSLVMTTCRPSVGPLRAGEHIVSRSLAEVAPVLTHYLDDEAQRADHAARASAKLLSERTLDKSVARLLALENESRGTRTNSIAA